MNAILMTELFGGSDRYRALRSLYERPDHTFGARELAAAADIDPGNASRWLRRWADVGLLTRTQEGRLARYRASADLGLQPLGMLLRQDSELVRSLRLKVDELADHIQAAAIFGSTAQGIAHADSDIDLLVLTDASRLEAQTWFKPVGRQLQRPVNVMAYTPQAWRQALADADPLVLDILAHPMMPLKGEIHAQKA